MTNQAIALRTGQAAPAAAARDVDMELVERAQEGDSEAFGQIYERTFDRVYRYIYFRVTNDEVAEDLSSRVYMKAWEHLPRYKAGKSPLMAWLYTIAHNQVVDFYRVTKPTTSLDEALWLPSKDPLPDEQYERLSESQALRKALFQLTDTQRRVLTMRLIDGMDTDTVAAKMHKSAGAVRALQMRGLQALAKVLRSGDQLPDRREA